MERLEQYEQIKKGVGHWNEWRKEHPDDIIDLSGLRIEGEYSNVNLAGANLYGCDMSGSHFENAHFENATLSMANLTKAQLVGAHLQGAELIAANLTLADLSCAHLENTKMGMVNLTNAKILLAHLQGANLSGARLINAQLIESDITETDFSYAYLGNTNVARVKYSRSRMDGKYQGIRVEGCYGNAVFKRDAQDQDYIDTLRPLWSKGWRKPMFAMWAFIDYGRSIPRVALTAFTIILFFGLLYAIFPGLVDYGIVVAPHANTPYMPNHPTWFEPFYYSVVTFTTLGFGDVSAKGVAGQMAVVIEVVLGYITLGLLISILGNMVARRS